MASELETQPDATSSRPAESPKFRVIYRSPAGEVQFSESIELVQRAISEPDAVLWLDIEADGGGVAAIDGLFRNVFGFHPLAIDDALRESHIPKLDDWGAYLYMVFHTIDFHPEDQAVKLRELDVFLGKNYLVTLHFDAMPPLAQLRRTLEREGGERLKDGADHILYHVLDQSAAAFLVAIEKMDEAIDEAQDEVLDDPTQRTLQSILKIKRAALRVHRVISPQREVINRLARDSYPMIDARDRVYFRDVYDHMVRLHDISETLRDLIGGALDTYLSAISNRTNDVMKTLTIVTVLFLPLNFLVGFFGMNFFGDNIALTDVRVPHVIIFGLACLAMVGSPVVIWFWGKRRGWF